MFRFRRCAWTCSRVCSPVHHQATAPMPSTKPIASPSDEPAQNATYKRTAREPQISASGVVRVASNGSASRSPGCGTSSPHLIAPSRRAPAERARLERYAHLAQAHQRLVEIARDLDAHARVAQRDLGRALRVAQPVAMRLELEPEGAAAMDEDEIGGARHRALRESGRVRARSLLLRQREERRLLGK